MEYTRYFFFQFHAARQGDVNNGLRSCLDYTPSMEPLVGRRKEKVKLTHSESRQHASTKAILAKTFILVMKTN